MFNQKIVKEGNNFSIFIRNLIAIFIFTLVLSGHSALSASSIYEPMISDPLSEPWRWSYFSELAGKGVYCMTQDRDGRMWFGTDQGVLSYDGLTWYTQPASIWEEALTLGNGHLGAMVLGNPAKERIDLNDDTFWAGSPYQNNNPEHLKQFRTIQQLIGDKNYQAAQILSNAVAYSKNAHGLPYWQQYGYFIGGTIDNPNVIDK